MLILSRKSGESIVIDGRIHVKIVRVEGEAVKIGIEAPLDVPVHRREVYEEIQRSNQLALTRQSVELPKLPLAATAKPRRKTAKKLTEKILAAGPAATDSGTTLPEGNGVPDHAPQPGRGAFQ